MGMRTLSRRSRFTERRRKSSWARSHGAPPSKNEDPACPHLYGPMDCGAAGSPFFGRPMRMPSAISACDSEVAGGVFFLSVTSIASAPPRAGVLTLRLVCGSATRRGR
jgi:hypothetical protein